MCGFELIEAKDELLTTSKRCENIANASYRKKYTGRNTPTSAGTFAQIYHLTGVKV